MDFSKTINKTRQVELDIAKCMAIIFMVYVHLLEEFHGNVYPNTYLRIFIEFCGGPLAAPVFMICLGIGIVYSSKSSHAYLFKRGLSLICLGYILNIIREIPYIIAFFINHDNSFISDAIACIFSVDILQFSGLSFIFVSFIKKFNLSLLKTSLITIFIVILGMILGNVSCDFLGKHIIIGEFLGLFIYTNEYTWFPSTLWICFPIIGYVFGNFLICTKNKSNFYKKIFLSCTLIFISLTLIFIKYRISFFNVFSVYSDEYYKLDLLKIIFITSIVFIWFSFLYLISLKISRFERLIYFIKSVSSNLLKIYFIQWILISIIYVLSYNFTLNHISLFILGFILIILLVFCSFLIDTFKKRR